MAKILVVDDERKIRQLYVNLLTAEGFEVLEASDMKDASEALLKENIDLVLLDIKMPKFDGGTVYSVIGIFNKKTKVIVSSVYPLEEQRRIIPGAVDYYDKSEGVDALLAKVKEVLKDGPIEKDTRY